MADGPSRKQEYPRAFYAVLPFAVCDPCDAHQFGHFGSGWWLGRYLQSYVVKCHVVLQIENPRPVGRGFLLSDLHQVHPDAGEG